MNFNPDRKAQFVDMPQAHRGLLYEVQRVKLATFEREIPLASACAIRGNEQLVERPRSFNQAHA